MKAFTSALALINLPTCLIMKSGYARITRCMPGLQDSEDAAALLDADWTTSMQDSSARWEEGWKVRVIAT